jgi:DNA-binding MarR family transcriptional regulator
MLSSRKLCHTDSVLSINQSSQIAKLMPLFVADVFHLAGEFRQLGNRIASRVGQTQARWQVLSVVSHGTWTVAQVARRLGYARQSVQRTADQLVQQKLAEYRPNPDHAKSPVIEITSKGNLVLARITREAGKWHLKISAGLEGSELAIAARTVRHLCATLEIHLGKKRAEQH